MDKLSVDQRKITQIAKKLLQRIYMEAKRKLLPGENGPIFQLSYHNNFSIQACFELGSGQSEMSLRNVKSKNRMDIRNQMR